MAESAYQEVLPPHYTKSYHLKMVSVTFIDRISHIVKLIFCVPAATSQAGVPAARAWSRVREVPEGVGGIVRASVEGRTTAVRRGVHHRKPLRARSKSNANGLSRNLHACSMFSSCLAASAARWGGVGLKREVASVGARQSAEDSRNVQLRQQADGPRRPVRPQGDQPSNLQ